EGVGGAGEGEACGNEHGGWGALVGGRRARGGGPGGGLPAGGEAVPAVIEAHDLIDALDAHIERAAVLRDRFGIEPAAVGERPSIGAENRRHLGIDDAARPRPVVDDAAAQPPALVAERDEDRAVGADTNGADSPGL